MISKRHREKRRRRISLDTDIIIILAKSLGPSSPIFLKQICSLKLKKQPSEITKADLDILIGHVYEGVKKTLGDETAHKIREDLKTLK